MGRSRFGRLRGSDVILVMTTILVITIPLLPVADAFMEYFEGTPLYQSLDKLQQLTFKTGELTKTWNSIPVNQLRNVGGSAQGLYAPAEISCWNQGGREGSDFTTGGVSWKCQVKDDAMPSYYVLGPVSVECEGYSDSTGGSDVNQRIIDGSCSLNYTINLSSSGWHKVQELAKGPSSSFSSSSWPLTLSFFSGAVAGFSLCAYLYRYARGIGFL